jgi:hypothetical protein
LPFLPYFPTSVAAQPDEVSNSSERTEIVAPGPFDKHGCYEHHSEQYKMKICSDETEKRAEDLIAG